MKKMISLLTAITLMSIIGLATTDVLAGNQAQQTANRNAATAASASNSISPKVFRYAEDLYEKESRGDFNPKRKTVKWEATIWGFQYAEILITWDGKICLFGTWGNMCEKILGTWGDE